MPEDPLDDVLAALAYTCAMVEGDREAAEALLTGLNANRLALMVGSLASQVTGALQLYEQVTGVNPVTVLDLWQREAVRRVVEGDD